MRWQHREGQAAETTKVTLDALLLRNFRFCVALVASMTVDHARKTARTHWARSLEVAVAKLNRGAFPKSSPFYFGFHDLNAPLSSLTSRTPVPATHFPGGLGPLGWHLPVKGIMRIMHIMQQPGIWMHDRHDPHDSGVRGIRSEYRQAFANYAFSQGRSLPA